MTATDQNTGITLEDLAGRIETFRGSGRRCVAIAGPPASGKSTLATRLCDMLRARGVNAAVLQMDGFHYDDAVLRARGLLSRKGAPQTFDTGGLTALLERLTANEEPEIAVPVFDRTLEISRAGALIVPQDIDVLIVEGNYLLLDDPDWRDLSPLFDLTVMIATSEQTLRARLADRWQDLSADARRAKIEENDLPNGQQVIEGSIAPDLWLANDDT